MKADRMMLPLMKEGMPRWPIKEDGPWLLNSISSYSPCTSIRTYFHSHQAFVPAHLHALSIKVDSIVSVGLRQTHFISV